MLVNKNNFSSYNHDIHRKIKISTYKTIITIVLRYGSEIWTLARVTENLDVFESAILPKILADGDVGRIRYISELFNINDDLPTSALFDKTQKIATGRSRAANGRGKRHKKGYCMDAC